MPLYDFICEACGKVFEELQDMEKRIAVKCPHCGSEDVKRQLGAVSWYWDRNKPLNPGPKPPTKFFPGV